MKALERFGRLFEVVALVGCGFFTGATVTAVRVRASVTAALAPQLDACRADLTAHDDFIRLVVDDVEGAVARASRVLQVGAAYARPAAPLDPPIFHAAGGWWVVAEGKCMRVADGAVSP